MGEAAAAFDPDVVLAARPARSLARRALGRLGRKKIAMLAIVYLVVFYLGGIFAPLVAPHDPNEQHLTQAETRQAPSSEHWFGTDALGRDLFSRTLFAARTTIIFTVAVLLTGGVILGLGLGLLAGYRGGWVDTLIMRVGEVLNGLPPLLIMIALTAALRTHIEVWSRWLRDSTPLGEDAKTLLQFTIIVGAIVPFAWLGSSRIVRSQALAIREAEFVVAAELTGASTWRIVTRHILPGVMPLFIVGLSSGMAGIAGAEVALSFLGLGISPPTSSFGTLIADGAGPRTFQTYPHLLLAGSVPVIIFFFAWNLLGDSLVDILDPRLSVL